MLKKPILRKLAAMLTMTAMMLVTIVPALAQGAATDQYAPNGSAIQGAITEISGSVVFVEEDPSDSIATTPPTPPDTDKGFFRVTGETEILDQRGAEQVPATFEDLEAGQLVEATYVGPVTVASYPQQGTADRIVILKSTSEPDQEQPQCFLPEGCFLSGGYGDETIVGGIGPDYIIGGYGHDALYGLDNDDWLDGGAGDDLVRGNEGHDLVDGGSGHDLVIGGNGSDYVSGFTGNDILEAGAGNDFIYAADGWFDSISGGPGYNVCIVDPWDEVSGCEEVYTG